MKLKNEVEKLVKMHKEATEVKPEPEEEKKEDKEQLNDEEKDNKIKEL